MSVKSVNVTEDEGEIDEIHVGHLEKYNNFTIDDIVENIRWEGKQWNLIYQDTSVFRTPLLTGHVCLSQMPHLCT